MPLSTLAGYLFCSTVSFFLCFSFPLWISCSFSGVGDLGGNGAQQLCCLCRCCSCRCTIAAVIFLLFPFFFFFFPTSPSHALALSFPFTPSSQRTATVPAVSTFTLQRESLSSCSLAEPAHSITSQTEWQAGRQAESLGLSVFLGYLSPLGAFAFACLPVCLCACNEPASNTASAAAAVRKIRLALLTAHCHLMHFNLYFNIPPCKSDSQQHRQCVRCCLIRRLYPANTDRPAATLLAAAAAAVNSC